MPWRPSLLVVCLALILSGCATTHSMEFVPTPHPKPVVPAELLADPQKPEPLAPGYAATHP